MENLTKKETSVQKVQRHVAKEECLQKQINGNAPYRVTLIEAIIKDKLQGHDDDLQRLFKKTANYINCEPYYERLFAMIAAMGTTEQKAKALKFKKQTQLTKRK